MFNIELDFWNFDVSLWVVVVMMFGNLHAHIVSKIIIQTL